MFWPVETPFYRLFGDQFEVLNEYYNYASGYISV